MSQIFIFYFTFPLVLWGSTVKSPSGATGKDWSALWANRSQESGARVSLAALLWLARRNRRWGRRRWLPMRPWKRPSRPWGGHGGDRRGPGRPPYAEHACGPKLCVLYVETSVYTPRAYVPSTSRDVFYKHRAPCSWWLPCGFFNNFVPSRLRITGIYAHERVHPYTCISLYPMFSKKKIVSNTYVNVNASC